MEQNQIPLNRQSRRVYMDKCDNNDQRNKCANSDKSKKCDKRGNRDKPDNCDEQEKGKRDKHDKTFLYIL